MGTVLGLHHIWKTHPDPLGKGTLGEKLPRPYSCAYQAPPCYGGGHVGYSKGRCNPDEGPQRALSHREL